MQDLYPGATFLPSPNRWSGHQGQTIRAIIDHIAQGSLAGCDAILRDPSPGGDPDRAVSAHFAIGATGAIHQYVKLSDSAWGNGIVEAGNTMPATWPKVDPNWFTISIEHAGLTGQPLTPAQYQADLALHGWLLGQLQLPVTPDTITGHFRISPQTRAHCPGSAFYFERLRGDLSPINWGHHRIFIDWAAARWDNREVFWGIGGLVAFKNHLSALGCDATTPGEYGWPS